MQHDKAMSVRFSKIAREKVDIYIKSIEVGLGIVDRDILLFYKGKRFMALLGTNEDISRVRNAFVRLRGRNFEYDEVRKSLRASGEKVKKETDYDVREEDHGELREKWSNKERNPVSVIRT